MLENLATDSLQSLPEPLQQLAKQWTLLKAENEAMNRKCAYLQNQVSYYKSSLDRTNSNLIPLVERLENLSSKLNMRNSSSCKQDFMIKQAKNIHDIKKYWKIKMRKQDQEISKLNERLDKANKTIKLSKHHKSYFDSWKLRIKHAYEELRIDLVQDNNENLKIFQTSNDAKILNDLLGDISQSSCSEKLQMDSTSSTRPLLDITEHINNFQNCQNEGRKEFLSQNNHENHENQVEKLSSQLSVEILSTPPKIPTVIELKSSSQTQLNLSPSDEITHLDIGEDENDVKIESSSSTLEEDFTEEPLNNKIKLQNEIKFKNGVELQNGVKSSMVKDTPRNPFSTQSYHANFDDPDIPLILGRGSAIKEDIISQIPETTSHIDIKLTPKTGMKITEKSWNLLKEFRTTSTSTPITTISNSILNNKSMIKSAPQIQNNKYNNVNSGITCRKSTPNTLPRQTKLSFIQDTPTTNSMCPPPRKFNSARQEDKALRREIELWKRNFNQTEAQKLEEIMRIKRRRMQNGTNTNDKNQFEKANDLLTSKEHKNENPLQYKGHGRYASMVQDRPEEYVINKDENGGMNFEYQQVVRNKEIRKTMHGTDCECCRGFYNIVGPLPKLPIMIPWDEKNEDNINSLSSSPNSRLQNDVNEFTRHRHIGRSPARTPPGFWDATFPDTPTIARYNKEGRAMTRKKEEMMSREAARFDGLYKRVGKNDNNLNAKSKHA